MNAFKYSVALAAILVSSAAFADNLTVRDLSVEQAPVAAITSPHAGQLATTIVADRPDATYAIGETVRLTVTGNEDSYVTVLDVGPTGAVTELFPNKQALGPTRPSAEKMHRIVFAPLYGYPSETAHFIRKARDTEIEGDSRERREVLHQVSAPGQSPDRPGVRRWGAPERGGGEFLFYGRRAVHLVAFQEEQTFDELVKIAESI